MTPRQFEEGEVILREGEAGETAYIIERGRVEVTKALEGRSIHLAYVGAGEVFGEMSMIDDRPRSATITAVEHTVVQEVHRERFYEGLQSHPEAALSLLKVLFERLREAQSTILQLQMSGPKQTRAPDPTQVVVRARAGTPAEVVSVVQPVVSLAGLTPRASRTLHSKPFLVTTFPFRMGRRSADPLVHNDLMIDDSAPLQVSRHHVSLITDQGRIGVVDRGSTLGAQVDEQQIGGPKRDPGPIFFAGSTGTLVLGTIESQFRYRVTMVADGGAL